MIRAWNVGAILIAGLVIGYGMGWWMNRSESPNVYSVGDYDFIIGDYDSLVQPSDPTRWQRDDNDTALYSGFGMAWSVEPEQAEKDYPRLVALIMDGHLELVAYERLTPKLQAELQDAVAEERRRKFVPDVLLRYDDDVEDDAR